jgi:uncharacterized protein YoxC
MNKIMKLIGTASIAFICSMFVVFTIIHMSKVNDKIDEWDKSYKMIEEDLSTFVKISDPKTIRLYVKELNKILDDIHFLGKIVESGQLADESLLDISSRLDDIDNKFKFITTYSDSLFNIHRTWLNNHMSYIINNETELDSLGIILQDMDLKIIEKFQIIQTDLDSIRVMINNLEDSKIKKFW